MIISAIVLSGMLAVGAVIGSLQGLWLSSRILSPLVAGGVLGFVIAAFLSTSFTLMLAKLGEADVKEAALKNATHIVAVAVTSGLIGIGLGFTANAIFPGVMLAMGSPALVGTIIGAIAPTAGFLLTDKVNEYIISPVIEKVKGSSASQEPDECECSL